MPLESPKSKTLVIDVGDTYITGYLYSLEQDQLQLLDFSRYRKTFDNQQLIQSIQYEYRNRYEEMHVIGDRKEWFGNSIKNIYPEGVTVVLEVNGGKSRVGISSWGRIHVIKTYEWGTTIGLDELFDGEGLQRLQNWLAITGRGAISSDLINYLGNRKLYPGLRQNVSDIQDIIIGLLQTILHKITHDNPGMLQDDAIVNSKGAHRIVISGDIALEIEDYGTMLLALIDGLDLSGYWEIIIDARSLLTSLGFAELGNRIIMDELEFTSLGTVLIPSHSYPWDEYLGEMKVDLGLSEDQILELKSGEIIRLPLEKDSQGVIQLKVKPDVQLIGYQGTEGINGGLVGLMIDVRGRPLPPYHDVEKYQKKFSHWIEALT